MVNKKLFEAGLVRIQDLMTEANKFMSFQEFKGKYQTNDFITYEALIRSIPTHWRRLLKEGVAGQDNNLFLTWQKSTKQISLIYNKMSEDENL